MKYFVILSLCATLVFGFKINKYKRTPLGDYVDKASMKLLKEAFASAQDKNVIASPLGVLTLLSMYSAGTDGENRQEIMRLLGASDYRKLEESYSTLIERFSTMDPTSLMLANKIYLSKQYTLDTEFSNVTSSFYKCVVEQVDWTQKKNAMDSINKWTNEKTKGKLPSPVKEEAIDEATAAALFNVIFFQGHWHHNITEITEKEFHVDENTIVRKKMLKFSNSLSYYRDQENKYIVVELPYKEKGFRMVTVIPDAKDGFPAVLDKLVQRGLLEDVFAIEDHGGEIMLEIPKFEIKNTLKLTDILPKVGATRMFSEGARGVVRDQEVTVSKAFQEVFVKADEQGVMSGAVTDFIAAPLSSRHEAPPPTQIKVGFPFLFAILYEDIILYTGTYSH